MLYLFYTKYTNIPRYSPYFWILDYFTKQRYIKFNNHYILLNIYKIFIKNNKFVINYSYMKKTIQFKHMTQFLINFYYIKKSLKLVGVGYKINIGKTKQILELNIGYSHKIYIQLPVGVFYNIYKDNNYLDLLSYNKILLTTIIFKLTKLHKTDPYKGKGFFLVGKMFSPKFYKK